MYGKGYSQLTLSISSAAKICKALREGLEDFSKEEMTEGNDVSLNIASNELHATLMYDKRDPDIDPGVNRESYQGTITDVTKLGNPNGEYYALVLEVDSPGVQKRFKELQELGFEHSWPDLRVHISLNYGSATETAYSVVKRIFEQGKFPGEITLVDECWNKCKN